MSRYDKNRDRGGRVSVLIRNLPLDAQNDEVRRMFDKYGEVRDVYLPKDYYTGKFKGFAFVEFHDVADAEDAVRALDRTTYGGRELEVLFSKESRKTPREMIKREDTQVRPRGGRDSDRDYDRRDRGRDHDRDRDRDNDRDRSRRSSRRDSRSRSRSRSRGRGRSASRSPRKDRRSRSPERRKDSRSPREKRGDSRSPAREERGKADNGEAGEYQEE